MPAMTQLVRQCSGVWGFCDLSLALAVDQNGIRPTHMIAVLVRDSAILRAYDLVPDQSSRQVSESQLGEVAYRVARQFLARPERRLPRIG